MKTKRVILFIVEGITDKNSLSLIISRLLKDKNVQFHVVDGDITSSNDTTIQNCIPKVNEQVKTFLNINRFKRTDILKIIHLVDTDGAYISADLVKQQNLHKVLYTNENILTCNVSSIINRNKKKAQILDKLYSTKNIGQIDYYVYYFSCNLEHVLHNEPNLECKLKDEYSDEFVEKYYNNENEFIKFICNSEFAIEGNYYETWKFIKSGMNSLNRYCNFKLFWEEYIQSRINL